MEHNGEVDQADVVRPCRRPRAATTRRAIQTCPRISSSPPAPAKPTLRTLRPAPRRAQARCNTAAHCAWPDLRAQRTLSVRDSVVPRLPSSPPHFCSLSHRTHARCWQRSRRVIRRCGWRGGGTSHTPRRQEESEAALRGGRDLSARSPDISPRLADALQIMRSWGSSRFINPGRTLGRLPFLNQHRRIHKLTVHSARICHPTASDPLSSFPRSLGNSRNRPFADGS